MRIFVLGHLAVLICLLLSSEWALGSPITMRKAVGAKTNPENPGSLFHRVRSFGKAGAQGMRYKECKTTEKSSKMPVVCIHGFGGNADQFRHQLPELSKEGHDTFAIDLMGYGYSDKPSPKNYEVNELYNFENWAGQTTDFVDNVVKEPVMLVSNSVGGLVALQAAMERPDIIKGVILIDISLRLLHITKQNPIQKPLVKLVQDTLRETPMGAIFFSQVAEFRGLKNILNQAYAGDVTDETVDMILQPGLQPGAAEIFLDFISYSSGPLPEELLPRVTQPVRILWGEQDPWEPIEQGRQYADKTKFPCVDEFVTLPEGGHCPMDQPKAIESVNREILRYLKDYKL